MKQKVLLAVVLCLTLVSSALAHTWYIKPDGTGDAPTIKAGLDSAAYGDTLLLASGTYIEWRLSMKAGVALLGETGDPQSVTVDTDFKGWFLDIGPGMDSTTVVRGLKIIAGPFSGIMVGALSSPRLSNLVFYDNVSNTSGGGIYVNNGSPVISDCLFTECLTSDRGGGIYLVNGASATVTNVSFIRNHAPHSGGGLFAENSSVTLKDCLFQENTSSIKGGGLSLAGNAAATLENVLFIANRGSQYGGGISVVQSSLYMANCLLAGNSTTYEGGGGIWIDDSYPIITECTFHGNSADYGGGICTIRCGNGTVDVRNTIISYGTGGGAVHCVFPDTDVPLLTCCDIYGNVGGDWSGCIADQYLINGNISVDPEFCDPVNWDFHLDCSSPCSHGFGCGQIGAYGIGCGASRTEPTTWGAIKSMYR